MNKIGSVPISMGVWDLNEYNGILKILNKN